MKAMLKWLAIRLLWLVGIGLMAWLIAHSAAEAVGSPMLTVAATAAFIICAIYAGPPRLRHPATRRVWRIRFPTADERRRSRAYGYTDAATITQREVPTRNNRFLRLGALVACGLLTLGGVMVPIVRNRVAALMPADIEKLVKYSPAATTRVWSSDGELICEYTKEHRIPAKLQSIPLHVIQAFVAAEDKKFFEHHGTDPEAMLRAYLANRATGRKVQGASTLTQQIVKQLLLNPEKTTLRKTRELFLAVELEQRLSKERILEIYLTNVNLGHNSYGVEAAAQAYFGKTASRLTLAEAATLAGLPPAPNNYSPYSNFEKSKVRRAYVLRRMVEDKYILQADADRAMEQPLTIVYRPDILNRATAPYFCKVVETELTRLYGSDVTFGGGLNVVTTLDMKAQRAADAVVKGGLLDLERRIGWLGPEGRDASFTGCTGTREEVADNVVESGRLAFITDQNVAVCVRGGLYNLHPEDAARMRAFTKAAGKRMLPGDLVSVMVQPLLEAETAPGRTPRVSRYAILARRSGGPKVLDALQAGLIVIEPSSGDLKALVGGYDFLEDQWNVITQAKRQTGSSVKPYVYLTCLRTGQCSVETTMADHAVMVGNHLVQNYDLKYYGTVSLRTALAKSLNSISIQLIQRTGKDAFFKTLDALGIDTSNPDTMPRSDMVAIGLAEMTPWEHAYGIAQIAANGHAAPRHPNGLDGKPAKRVGRFISLVKDPQGNVLLEIKRTQPTERPVAIPEADAYATQYLMRGVVEEGTAKRVRELGWPAIGKTGTTNDFKDVWFEGCTPALCATVWVGRKTPDKPIVQHGDGEKADGATGGTVALPFWMAFMKTAHPTDQRPYDFPVPSDVVLVRNAAGDLLPYQRGRVPAQYMKGVASGASLGGPTVAPNSATALIRPIAPTAKPAPAVIAPKPAPAKPATPPRPAVPNDGVPATVRSGPAGRPVP